MFFRTKEVALPALAALSLLVPTISGCAENKGLACIAISLDENAIKKGIADQYTTDSTLCSGYANCGLANSACKAWWVVTQLATGGHISIKVLGYVDSSNNYAVCWANDPYLEKDCSCAA